MKAIGGALVGVAIGLALAAVAGESPNAIILAVFALVGFLIGSILGFPED